MVSATCLSLQVVDMVDMTLAQDTSHTVATEQRKLQCVTIVAL